MKVLIFSADFKKKYSNVNFRENSFGGRRVVSCGWTDGQTDMTKLIVAFRNSADAPYITSRDHSPLVISDEGVLQLFSTV